MFNTNDLVEMGQKLVKKSGAAVSAVATPVIAVSGAGSVAGLSASGITSGLATLGLGLGMVGGIGAVVIIGGLTYYAVDSMIEKLSDHES